MSGLSVQVDPPCVEFHDVSHGQVYRTTVRARNVGKTSKKIVIEKPELKLFRFTASSSAQVVPPGLSVSGVLEFTPKDDEEEVRDSLLVRVDDVETIRVPVLGFPKVCSLLMDSDLDFGCTAAVSQVITKHHPITNQGSAPGSFQVHYNGGPSVTLAPCSGIIAAGATQWIKVELRTDGPGLIDEKALVKLQNRSAAVLRIRAEVVDQRLEIFDMQGAPLSCLWFGPAYFGTSCVENIVLRNNAPQACDWVCLLQTAAAGTEAGTDLQKSTGAALLEGMKKCNSGTATQDVSQVVVCVPKQGHLGAYDQTTVTVRFSPTYKSEPKEEKDRSACRRDFCLFLLFESLGSRHGFTHNTADSSVELAVTGSGLPVSLLPSPSQRFDFRTCVKGRRVDLLCVLQNLCPLLPVTFRFRKLAHFTTKPSSGTIPPGQCQDVVVSFTARQQGSFQVLQQLDVLGRVVRRGSSAAEDEAGIELCSFHTVTLHLSAVCCVETTHPGPKLNPGITPAVTNPTGAQPHVRARDLARCRGMARAAVLAADKTRLHVHRRERRRGQEEEEEGEEREFLAFPNDRAASIRPASAHRQYRTIFTGVPRYCYVDTDYSFTEEEEKQRQQHRQIYKDFIEQLRRTRLERSRERQQEEVQDDVDIGIVPAQGLVPPSLDIRDLESSRIQERPPERSETKDVTSSTRQVSEVMHAVPSTSQEMADCAQTLSAEQLYQVEIGPLLVDFGEVCAQSVCVVKLQLINRLSAFVWVQLEVDSPELQGSSPLSHVLPPRSRNTLPLTFQSSKLGPFCRPVSYTVNQKHPGQIQVRAQVVPVALELSTTLLVLRPTPNLLAQSGYRSSVTLVNKRNHPAEFTWRPVVTESGVLFSIRPATGTVEPHRELDCEVLWHPSFSFPAEGDFDLCVHDGNTQRLHCVAKVGSTCVQLAEERVSFGSVPLDVTSTRAAVLHNSGQNHAYFQVLDDSPLPGLVVTPSEGVVPSGGQATLHIHFTPDSVIRFDARVEIALRGLKSVELRVGGSVEPVNVDMSVSHFQFHGVRAGSRRSIPFALSNRSPAAARVTFDLSEYEDFSVQLPRPSEDKGGGVRVVEVQGRQTLDCSLVFSPTQAASYDFDLPVKVNGVTWPAASSPSSSLAAGGRHHVVRNCPQSQSQPQRVQATVLCAPLEMTPSRLRFHVEPLAPESDAIMKTVELKAARGDSVFWRGGARESVGWRFDCTAIEARTESGGEGSHLLCTLSPTSGRLRPGQSVRLAVSVQPEAVEAGCRNVTDLSLPLYLGDEEEVEPYRELSITITHRRPRIAVHPPRLLLTPVPLGTNASASVTLLASGYPRGTSVSAEVDGVKQEDETIQPVSVIFPEGNSIPARSQNQKQEAGESALSCCVLFCSDVPLSLCTTITFTDHLHNRFKVPLCAVADNSQLTAWPYLALHRSDHQIVLKTGAKAVEAVLQSYPTASPAPGLHSSSSSSFDHNSSASKTPISGSESASSQESGHMSAGVPEFRAATSEEGLFHQNALLAAERWFSLFGWPGGPHPISVPHTLRRVASKILTVNSSGRTCRVSQSKDSRSVVDMLRHLTGAQIPGVPRCQTFPGDVEARAAQLLRQHEATLAFLRAQGACLCHIRPEYLLDVQEFKHWRSLQDPSALDYSSVDYESLSKRSWTDVLLQIYKVLVLCRVSQSGAQLEDLAGVLRLPSSRPPGSNVYSPSELRLLSWLNMHYLGTRERVWGTGNAPSARWIMNFDLDLTDGLVLAALLAAHCPYLICSHFQRMYTATRSLEQIFHNNVIVVDALTVLHLNMDVQPTDLSDPNPVQMLMLCVHLYERLPQYLPLRAVTLSGGLHCTLIKRVRLRSSSEKPVKYQVLLLGEDARLFSLPGGSTVTIPPKASAEVAVRYVCSVMQPKEAVLLLISSPPVGLCSTTLCFTLKTHVGHIKPTKTVKCRSPCYQMKVIQVPLTNPFNEDAQFRVVLVESPFNPLEPEKKRDSLVQQASSKANVEASDKSCEEETAGKPSDLSGEFSSAVRSVHLKSGQEETLLIHYLPFSPGPKYCSVLLVCPQVGDMVYVVKATAELPLPSPLTAWPSPNVASIPQNSHPAVCVSALRLRCRVGQVCEEVLRVPLANMAWEQALSMWGQQSMSAEERRRRMLTHTLHSSTVRARTAARKLLRQMRGGEEVEYSVEVSLPEHFTLPSTVRIPVKEDLLWENPAECGCVDVPLRFQADSVGQFTCQVVLKSWCDTRLYVLQADVTSPGGSVHLDFSSPAHRSVTQDIPLHNETRKDWNMHAELSGEGFSGPKVVNVPAGTKVNFPLTFQPAAQCTVTGRLSFRKDADGTEQVFTLRGVGERPLPVDHVTLHCPVGKTTNTQLDVPNYSHKTQYLKVVSDLSVVSGASSLEIKPGHSAPYTLAVSPWKQGKQTGCVSFVETDDAQEGGRHEGKPWGRYEARFTLEIICEPAAPVKVVDVRCAAQSSVAIEIPVSNPHGEELMLDVILEGDDLSGADRVSVPPRDALTYKATFSPVRVGKSGGSVLFQSELVGEFWYQLQLYALPPPVITLPPACCHLGKWTRQMIPVVNPTAETLKMLLYATATPETSRRRWIQAAHVAPFSSAQLAVRFSPSSVGEGDHAAEITFMCPQLQDWCVLLSGRGLEPPSQEPLSISSRSSVTVRNPTELPAWLSVTLTDADPSGGPECHRAAAHEEAFRVPPSLREGVRIEGGACVDVPVEFVPRSTGVQQAWLCITLKPQNSNENPDNPRSEQDSPTICWTYPLRGITVEAPVENSPLGVLSCEAGCQLEKKVDVELSGRVPWNGEGASQVTLDDLSCDVRADVVQHSLSASIEAARRDPDTGITTLTLNVVYTPLRRCRCAAVLVVRCVSGHIWEFPVDLVATEPQIDDIILMETTEPGETSAVGFRLTSATRRPEPFTAAFLPGSGGEFTVTPSSGVLPSVGSTGALITVSFTPNTRGEHRARLTVQAADMRWTYEVTASTSNDERQ